jgi:hypothetical protein
MEKHFLCPRKHTFLPTTKANPLIVYRGVIANKYVALAKAEYF